MDTGYKLILWIIVDWRVCRAHACQIQNVGAEVLFGARR